MAPWREDRVEEIIWIEGEERPADGMKYRAYASAIICIGWLAFFLLWLFFAADELSIYRNIAIIFLSLVVAAALLGALWVTYGMSIGMRYAPQMAEAREFRTIRGRIIATTALWSAWAALIIIWLYFFADGLSGYQNVAVFIISLIVATVASSLLWMRYMGRW